MKRFKFVLVFALTFFALSAAAQKEVILKAGSLVPLRVVNSVRASKVKKGETVWFKVSQDVMVNGEVAIPYGTRVKGTVTLAKRSKWFGTKGRLGIKIGDIYLDNGGIVPLDNNNVQVSGKNRTALSVLLFLFVSWPCCFICGSKAEMTDGYEVHTQVASNTILKIF